MATPKFTVEQMSTALIKNRGMVSLAAKALECDPDTVRRYMRNHPSIQQVVDDQRDRLIDSAELKLVEAVERKGEPWAIALVLKTLGKKRGYVERIEQTGADGAPMEHRIGPSLNLADATDDELAVLERLSNRTLGTGEDRALPSPPD